METFNEVWLAVLDYCKDKVNNTGYSLWLEPTKVSKFENNAVELSLSSTLKKDVVEVQYGALLKEAFLAVMGFEVEIKYTCPEDLLSETEKNKKDLEEYKNEQFTFDNFIVGPSNKFAFAAAKSVAVDPGGRVNGIRGIVNFSNYNPLFIYGNSGLGKTHILKAICCEVERSYPDMTVCYISSEDFANEFIDSLGRGTTNQFHNKYRNDIDVLLVDDIQFIAGKTQTEEEFFHTFNSLVENGKQIVLSSDRPPKEILSLTDRLRSRFENGLLADIQPPEYETRCAIIKRKAELLNFNIPDAVVNYIAERIKTNIRQLEGTTKKLFAMSEIGNSVPTIALAQTAIKDILNTTQPLPVTIQTIVDEVSRTTGVSVEDIYSKKQTANVTNARKTVMYIMREVTDMSYEMIGDEFKKDHSTVMYNIKQITKLMEKDSKLARQINDIVSNIKDNQ